MKALLFVVAAAALVSCAQPDAPRRSFANNDLELAVGNGARMACSCMYVMNMSETYCRAWVKASPDVAYLNFDTTRKTVVAGAFVSWSASARYVDDKRGCVLE